MCGLYGFINRGDKKINSNGLVKAMSVAAMTRGTHATGVAYNVGKKLIVLKAPVSADKFVLDLPKNVSAVIGHTRHTTQGTQFKNHNNHPFLGVAGDTQFALAHNGVLDNDDILQYTEKLPKTEIETDTYVAVQLMEKYANNEPLDIGAIRNASELVSGMFAFTVLDNNNNFWIIRNDSPLYLVYFDKLNLYVYGSTKEIVEAGLKAAGLATYTVVSVGVGEIIRIDENGVLHRFNFEVNERYYNPSSKWYSIANGNKTATTTTTTYYNDGWGAGWQEDYYDQLLRHDLFDYGFEDEEVDLLFDTYGTRYVEETLYGTDGENQVRDLLYEALRTFFINTYERGYAKKDNVVPYVSPIYK
jgi:glucosamine 6-phosphate synthetase-like amidotransferase/phosphosugar isomerase protein